VFNQGYKVGGTRQTEYLGVDTLIDTPGKDRVRGRGEIVGEEAASTNSESVTQEHLN